MPPIIPFETFILTVLPKKFYSTNHEEVEGRHFFLCIHILDETYFFLVCTSQIEKKENYLEKTGLPYSTCVFLSQDNYGFITKDTIVDCNEFGKLNFSNSEIKVQYEAGNFIKIDDELLEDDLQQILTGIHTSPRVKRFYKKLISTSIDEKTKEEDDKKEN